MALGGGKCGGVTFVQRFGGAINLNVHFHSLVFDGIYYEDEDGRIRFRRLPPPTESEVAGVTADIVKKILRLLERRGLGAQTGYEEADPFPRDQPLLAELYAASVRGRVGVGPATGERLEGIKFEFESAGEAKRGRCCADLSGFSLHAAVCIPANARGQLENLCRYVARPAVATERLSRFPDGRVLYRLRHRWRDGTSYVIFDPLDLVGKLAALVPPPRFNLVAFWLPRPAGGRASCHRSRSTGTIRRAVRPVAGRNGAGAGAERDSRLRLHYTRVTIPGRS